MISLGRRLVIGLTACTALVVGVACLAVWWGARWHAHRSLLDELDERTGFAVHIAGERRRPPRDMPAPPNLRVGSGTVFFQVLSADGGREHTRSPSLPSEGPGLAAALAAVPLGEPARVRLADGRAVLGRRLLVDPSVRRHPPRPPWEADGPEADGPEADAGLRLALVAVDASQAERELLRLAAILALVWVLASALALAGGLWLRGAVLSPVRRLAAAIRAIDPGHPGQGIAVAVPEEMTVVVERLRELLARLDGVVERERATLAALAHELRTPVAGLRTALEFAAIAEPPAAAPDLARRCLPTVEAMQAMIANLLLLARLESGSEQVRTGMVDAGAAVAAAWLPLAARAAARGQRLEVAAGPPPPLRTSPDHLALVLANLLGNAVDHGRAGAGVQVSFADGADGVRIRVANPFDGPPPDPARIFAPFWRGDPARSGGTHCGLGLALVRRVLRLLGGDAEALVEGDRFVCVLHLPPAGG